MLQTYKNFTPMVSVIMATYNRAAYLPRSIESVIKQTFKDWELIVIDDGSNDTTFDVINSYILRNIHLRFIKIEHVGPAFARNLGVTVSSASYITFLDSDDEYKDSHLQSRLQHVVQHPTIDLIHGGFEIIGDPLVVDWHDQSKKIHLNDCHIEGTFFGKREYFLQNGFKEMSFAEGLELVERTKNRYRIERVNWPTYVYHRDTPGSILSRITQ